MRYLALLFLAFCSKKDPEPVKVAPTPTVERIIAPVPCASIVPPPIVSSAARVTPPGPVGPGEGMKAVGATWEVEVPSPRVCERMVECTMVVLVRAKNGFHVNTEYPAKLTMDEAQGVTLMGKDPKGKNVFSKAAGDYVIDTATSAAMMTHFMPSSAGIQKMSGTLKFSVCSDANCQMESAHITAGVPVR